MQRKGCFQKTYRKWICSFLHTLIFGQIFIGLMVIIVSEYWKTLLGKYMPEIEQTEINMKLFLFELFGINVFLSYMGGLPLIRKSLRDPYTSHLGSLLKLWHFFICTASLNGIFGGYMLNGSRKFLKTVVESTLYRGIEFYYSDPQSRLLWDAFQYNEQCCGVVDFKDWQAVSWIENDKTEKLLSANQSEETLLSLMPYSCYKKVAGSDEDPVPLTLPIMINEEPHLNLTAFNENGCFNIFALRLDRICIMVFIVVGIVFVFQVFILIVMRIVFMSNRTFKVIRTSNKQSQTEIARGSPIIFNSSLNGIESLELINQCDETTLYAKNSKQYTTKSNRISVKFADSKSDDEVDETSKLLCESSK